LNKHTPNKLIWTIDGRKACNMMAHLYHGLETFVELVALLPVLKRSNNTLLNNRPSLCSTTADRFCASGIQSTISCPHFWELQ
jgi:hypothetical protein